MKQDKQLFDKAEELILQVAAQDYDSAQALITLLSGYQVDTVPKDLKKLLTDNINIVMENLDQMVKYSVIRELFLKLAALGVDSMQLRDALAAVSRELNSSYPDPSGLINALGIFDIKVPVQEVSNRWHVFTVLKENSVVWHPSYGLGRVSEIDPFSDLVYVEFKNKHHFNLAQSLTSLSVAKANTMASDLASDANFRMPANKTPEEFDRCIAEDFVPKLKRAEVVTEALLVPKIMNKKSYALWRTENSSSHPERPKKIQERTWRTARGLEELKICLAKVNSISPKDNDIDNLRKIFNLGATKPLSRFIFGEAISTLWSYCPNAGWFVELIKGLPENTVAWSSSENFVEVTCKLSSKLVPNWLEISDIAKGQEWFIGMVMELPLRFWPSPKHPLMRSQDFVDGLSAAALEKLKKGGASADTVIWVWENRRQEAEGVFTNPNLIVRVLNKNVKGEYLKSYKKLHRLLLEDRDFQKVLMDNGSTQGIKTFVRTIKGTPILNKGEQQSLLVKIIRIYPEAQSFVEERKKVVAKRALPKKTSVRSFEQRRQELEEIINVKIPKNSAAIGHARSYGDLRENAEFKAAKDEQRLLMARRRELEKDLKEIMATDFSDVRVFETVIPGCSVHLKVDGKRDETYHILGLWDSNPEKNILSYDSPLGRLLVGKKIGESLSTPSGLPAKVTDICELGQSIIQEWVNLPEKNTS